MPGHLILSHCPSTQLNPLNTQRYLRGNYKSGTYHSRCKESAMTQVCLMTLGASLHPVLIHVLLQNESLITHLLTQQRRSSGETAERTDRQVRMWKVFVDSNCEPPETSCPNKYGKFTATLQSKEEEELGCILAAGVRQRAAMLLSTELAKGCNAT